MTKRNTPLRLAAAGLALAALVLGLATFVVKEGEQVVVTTFGNPVREVTEAGLYFKWPSPVQTIHRFDARQQILFSRLSESLTADKKNVVVVAAMTWKVTSPIRFLQSVGSIELAKEKFEVIFTNAKSAVLGRYELSALVSTDTTLIDHDSIEKEMFEMVRNQAEEPFGIHVIRIGLQRVALPQANTQFVFQRMKAERQQYAAKYRAEGQKEAEKIRATTDLERSRIIAEATRRAEEIRGGAEAEAARIYSAAHRTDPEFYEYVRSLEALKSILNNKSTIVLQTDAKPFEYLEQGPPVKD